MSRTWTLDLPWTKPPLSANQRLHWKPNAAITARVRRATKLLALSAGIPPLGRCEVTLTYNPTDKRRRDADNPVPTLKAACDGLVDALVVADDIPALMRKHMPVIGPVVRGGRLTLTVTEVNE